ncbi:MAG: tRNA 2-thiouridine(34) synthase MnmA [Acidobacteria bacterium]|nr:MAG: tRNA 2-thiouridine(34) synthase MnmA [Acidobacteriota bacterium]
MAPRRVMVAMSGGVDSSVAAALLCEKGFDVTGVTLKLWRSESGCCTAADADDARAVARRLGIRHYVLDYETEFREAVVVPTIEGYIAGETPNPCIECNRMIKFRLLIERANALGCAFLATGHHARISRIACGGHRLLRAVDQAKDQSYVLYMLGQEELASMLFPVGEMTKDRVRAEAARLGLRTAEKFDSQDVCFAPDSMRDFLEREAAGALVPGEIRDAAGAVIGTHDGAALFTVGQRRGVGAPTGRRVYVTEIEAGDGVVKVGERGDLDARSIRASDATWVSGVPPELGAPVEVKARYGAHPVSGRLNEIGDHHFRVDLDAAVWAPAPGQALVCYQGEELLGGGTIRSWSAFAQPGVESAADRVHVGDEPVHRQTPCSRNWRH